MFIVGSLIKNKLLCLITWTNIKIKVFDGRLNEMIVFVISLSKKQITLLLTTNLTSKYAVKSIEKSTDFFVARWSDSSEK
jgi:hypothetical protein